MHALCSTQSTGRVRLGLLALEELLSVGRGSWKRAELLNHNRPVVLSDDEFHKCTTMGAVRLWGGEDRERSFCRKRHKMEQFLR